MSPKKYEGPLTHTMILRGFQNCIQNAQELCEEAELLFKDKRYARAYALTLICFEEIGKLMVLLTGAYHGPRDKALWRKFWKRFRSHTLKRTRVSLMEMLSLQSTTAEQTIVEMEAEPEAEGLKQSALYVDYRDGNMVCPSELWGERSRSLVEESLKLARNRLRLFSKQFGDSRKMEEYVTRRIPSMKRRGLADSDGMNETGRDWLDNQLKRVLEDPSGEAADSEPNS